MARFSSKLSSSSLFKTGHQDLYLTSALASAATGLALPSVASAQREMSPKEVFMVQGIW